MYTVPLIPPDLRHEETIIQAANALDVLQRTINFVFNQIDGRVQTNSARLVALGDRIEKAQSKIRSLVGSKKAIKIFSPARFPATQVFHDIPQTFSDTEVASVAMQATSTPAEDEYEVQSRVEAANSQTAQEKLMFFHVRTGSSSKTGGATADETTSDTQRLRAEKEQTNRLTSMGAMPEDLRSVSSLLLFNSSDPVYDTSLGSGEQEDSSASWKRAKLFKHQRAPMPHPQSHDEKQKQQLLGPPPASLVNRHQRMATPAGALRYTPKLNQAPDLVDLPSDLPDLPGIADDVQYERQQQQTIAPSLLYESLPELPELNEEAKQEEQKSEAASIPTAPSEPKQLAVAAQSAAPLPPPPPPPPAPTTGQSAAAGAPPPPPPPPPPPQVLASSPTPVAGPKTSNSPINLRSELMDSIRKAGGARNLKSANTDAQRPDDVDGEKRKLAASGGDLMADLHNKLKMRRKGISGAKDGTAEQQTAANAMGGGSVISRLSELIPPPPAKLRAQNTSDDDDDGDDQWVD